MRRVYLTTDTMALNVPQIELVRDASVALAVWACSGGQVLLYTGMSLPGRTCGDPVFEEVCEGRCHSPRYSTCGDLPQWVLARLGCRDERLVNRTDDHGRQPWAIGQNLSRIVYGSSAFVTRQGRALPGRGDPIYVAQPEHVAVCLDVDEVSGLIHVAEYGQVDSRGRQAGVLRTYPLRWSAAGWIVGQRQLMGWLDLSGIVLAETAEVPDGFEGGIVDENPYDE